MSDNGYDFARAMEGIERCPCGRNHPIRTRSIQIGKGAISRIPEVLAQAGLAGTALLVADENTYDAAGRRVEEAFTEARLSIRKFVFPAGELHTDEHAVGSVLMALDDDITFLAAVGSGTINDICRFVAKRTGLPYLVVGTAPSMDGYASDVSPAVFGGFKMTFRGVAPMAIVGDTDVLKNAPLNMMAAGFGDVFGKVTARLDWLMAHLLLGEYRCETVAGIMAQAVEACMAAAPGLVRREESAVEGLMNGLVLSGIAMQMVGDSRPASGCEHHVAHFWEMRDMARGRKSTLHGDKVGMAELVTMRLYEKFFEMGLPSVIAATGPTDESVAMRRDLGAFAETVLSQNFTAVFDGSEVRSAIWEGIRRHWGFFAAETVKLPALRQAGEESLRRMGGPVRPRDLGYDREDIRLALRYAMELRNKFTILRLAHMTGRLDTLAEELADEFCK